MRTDERRDGNIDIVLSRLNNVRKSGRGYIASCPAHDDRKPSLSIARGEDGRTLLYCFSGCELDNICEAIGLRVTDLFPDTKNMTVKEKRQYNEYKSKRSVEGDFRELRRQAFIAMCEFKDLAHIQLDYHKLDVPDEVLKAIHMIELLEWQSEILAIGSMESQLQLLREGVLARWSQLYRKQIRR